MLKWLLIAIFCFPAFAEEVTTDCPAMNEAREKILKKNSGSAKPRKKVSSQ